MQPERQIGKRCPHGILVCARQACCAEFNAAEVAGYYASKFADIAVQQNRQHGPAGGAVRFAVVIACDPGCIAGRACAKGPAVVSGIGILPSLGLDKGASVFNTCAVGDCSEKTAAANQNLYTVRLAGGEIGDLVSFGHALL